MDKYTFASKLVAPIDTTRFVSILDAPEWQEDPVIEDIAGRWYYVPSTIEPPVGGIIYVGRAADDECYIITLSDLESENPPTADSGRITFQHLCLEEWYPIDVDEIPDVIANAAINGLYNASFKLPLIIVGATIALAAICVMK